MTQYPRTRRMLAGLRILFGEHKITSSEVVSQLSQFTETLEGENIDLTRVNDALAAKVAEWKARAEKAETALKAAEDDRHLCKP